MTAEPADGDADADAAAEGVADPAVDADDEGPGSVGEQVVSLLGAEGTVATLGFVLVGLALVLTRLGGAPPATAVPGLGVPAAYVGWAGAAVALVTFLVARHGVVDARLAGGVAALFSLSVLVGDALTVYGVLAVWQLPLGFPLAWVPAGFAAALGAGLALRVPARRILQVSRYAAVALLIGAFGFIVGNVGALIFALVPLSLVPSDSVSLRLVVFTVGFGLSLAVFAAVVLVTLGYDWSYVDVEWPSLIDLVMVVLGVGGLFVALAGIGAALQVLGVPTAASGIEESAREFEDPAFLLWLVPLSWLVIGPGEELVYRNLVQKYLRETLSPWAGIAVASLIFAGVHFSQYASPSPLATTVTLAMIFALAMILGYTYEKTGNLVVPILIHGTFNAVQFALLYLTITGTIPGSA